MQEQTISPRGERAKQFFLEGYNCSQAVVLAFEDLFPNLDRATLLRAASSFGGGMGRLREVCGTVSGMFLVLGLLSGYDTPDTGALKAAHYARVQDLAHRFEALHGSIVCRDLLGSKAPHDPPVPSPRTPDFYRSRPCLALVASAASILEEYLG